MVNNSNVMMQTATFQNDSSEHKVLRPHKTVKQGISNKHQKAKKKSTTSKNHHNSVFKQTNFMINDAKHAQKTNEETPDKHEYF